MNQPHPAITEQEILEALRRLPTERWSEVLQLLRDLEEGSRLAAEFDPARPSARAYTRGPGGRGHPGGRHLPQRCPERGRPWAGLAAAPAVAAGGPPAASPATGGPPVATDWGPAAVTASG
jgi:hypothetical protein